MPACQPAEVREYQTYDQTPGQGLEDIRPFTLAKTGGATTASGSSGLRFSMHWDRVSTSSGPGYDATSDFLLALSSGALVPPERWPLTGASAPQRAKVVFSAAAQLACLTTGPARVDPRAAADPGGWYLSPGERGGPVEEMEMVPSRRLGSPLPMKSKGRT